MGNDSDKSVPPETPKNVEFFYVSDRKLVIFSIFTLCLYQIYYQYKNWKALKEQGGRNVSPFWRALIFHIFFCYSLFNEIITHARKHGYKERVSPVWLTIAYLFMWLVLPHLPGLFPLLALFSFIPLLELQRAIKFNNLKINPNAKPNDEFYPKRVGIFLAASLVLILIAYVFFTWSDSQPWPQDKWKPMACNEIFPEGYLADLGTPDNPEFHFKSWDMKNGWTLALDMFEKSKCRKGINQNENPNLYYCDGDSFVKRGSEIKDAQGNVIRDEREYAGITNMILVGEIIGGRISGHIVNMTCWKGI